MIYTVTINDHEVEAGSFVEAKNAARSLAILHSPNPAYVERDGEFLLRYTAPTCRHCCGTGHEPLQITRP